MCAMSEAPKKIILLGYFGVGKTSLIKRYVHQEFSFNYLTTIGVHIEKKIEYVKDRQIPLIIWDIAGEKAVKKISGKYLKHAHGLIYLFDLSRPATYTNLEEQLEELNNMFPGLPRVIAGNKKDLIPSNTGLKFPIDCYMTSAKTGENVHQIFKELAKQIL